jgi:hypothetical protein
MKTELGAALIPVLEELLPAIQPIIEQATPMLISLFEALVPILKAVTENIAPLFEAMSPLIVAFEMILGVAGEVLAQVLPALIDIFAALAPIVTDVVAALLPLIELVLPALMNLVNTILPILTEWWSILSMVLVPIIEVLAKTLGVALAVALTAITKLIQIAIDFFRPFFEAMKPGIINLVTEAIQGLQSFLGPLLAGLKPIVDALLEFAGIDPASLKKELVITTKIIDPADTGERGRFSNLAKSIAPVIPNTLTTTPKPGGTGDSAAKAREAAVKERAALKKVIADTREAFFKARQDYLEDVIDITDKYDAKQAEIGKAYDKDVTAANKRFAEQTADIAERYNEAVTESTLKRDSSLNSALKEHNKRIANIQADFAKRQADLIQQSMDRLRNAYKSAVSINVASIFDSDRIAGSIDGLVETLRDKLTASRRLIENAAKLSALGFSQTFIEQVVGGGTDVGNELAESIIGASPETVAELKRL